MVGRRLSFSFTIVDKGVDQGILLGVPPNVVGVLASTCISRKFSCAAGVIYAWLWPDRITQNLCLQGLTRELHQRNFGKLSLNLAKLFTVKSFFYWFYLFFSLFLKCLWESVMFHLSRFALSV
jgi:hypothetical protein